MTFLDEMKMHRGRRGRRHVLGHIVRRRSYCKSQHPCCTSQPRLYLAEHQLMRLISFYLKCWSIAWLRCRYTNAELGWGVWNTMSRSCRTRCTHGRTPRCVRCVNAFFTPYHLHVSKQEKPGDTGGALTLFGRPLIKPDWIRDSSTCMSHLL